MGPCPKETFIGKDVIELGKASAVCHLNDGSSAILRVFTRIGFEPGVHTTMACKSTSSTLTDTIQQWLDDLKEA